MILIDGSKQECQPIALT